MSDEPSGAVELREQLDSLCNDECLNEEAVGLLDDFGYDAITALEAAEAHVRRRGKEIAAWLLLVGVDILGLDGAPDAGEDEGLGISPVGRQLTFVSAALRSYKRRADERGEQIEWMREEFAATKRECAYANKEAARVGPLVLGRDAAKAAAERLAEALRPFAAVAAGIPGNWPEQCPIDWREGRAEDGSAYHYIGYLKALAGTPAPRIAAYRKAEQALAADAAAPDDMFALAPELRARAEALGISGFRVTPGATAQQHIALIERHVRLLEAETADAKAPGGDPPHEPREEKSP